LIDNIETIFKNFNADAETSIITVYLMKYAIKVDHIKMQIHCDQLSYKKDFYD